jgi:hypothetical protein
MDEANEKFSIQYNEEFCGFTDHIMSDSHYVEGYGGMVMCPGANTKFWYREWDGKAPSSYILRKQMGNVRNRLVILPQGGFRYYQRSASRHVERKTSQ